MCQTRQDKVRQDKAKQDKAKQDKVTQVGEVPKKKFCLHFRDLSAAFPFRSEGIAFSNGSDVCVSKTANRNEVNPNPNPIPNPKDLGLGFGVGLIQTSG
jgi:hypothetical protein